MASGAPVLELMTQLDLSQGKTEAVGKEGVAIYAYNLDAQNPDDPQGENYEIIENRPAAIRHAMDIAGKDDIIVLAGKGHETYQEIHGVKHHLDEREVVAAYLEEMRG